MAGQPMWVLFIASNMFSLMIKSIYYKENTSHTSQFSGGCLGVGSSLLWSSQWGWHYWWGGGGKSRGGTQRRDLQLLSTKCVILWRLIRVIIRPPEEVFTIFWWRTKLHNFEGAKNGADKLSDPSNPSGRKLWKNPPPGFQKPNTTPTVKRQQINQRII